MTSIGKFKTLKKTCSVCPSQWEGQLEDGRYVYARYRWGHLSVRSSTESIDDAVRAGEEIFEGSPEGADSLDGVMSTCEMLKLTGLERNGKPKDSGGSGESGNEV